MALFSPCFLQSIWQRKRTCGWHSSIDFEKAFDRVPREVIWWALRYQGVDEWLISVIKAMCADATTMVKQNGRMSRV